MHRNRYGLGGILAPSRVLRVAALTAALAVAFAASCDMPETFTAEYRDSSANFIASYSIAAPSAGANAAGATGLDIPASWDWAWRGNAGSGNVFEYMTLADTGAVGSDISSGAFTLAATTEAWTLELRNLAGNPYFEGDTVGATPSGWDVHDTTTVGIPTAQVIASTSTSHGKSMRLVSFDKDWAGFDPNTPGFILDDPSTFTTNTYRLSASASYSASFINYVVGYATEMFSDPKNSYISGARNVFDTFTVPFPTTRFMFAQRDRSQSIDIDDLRIVRLGIKDYLRLRVLLRPSDTTPGLVAGRYEFSLWVKLPTGSLSYDDSARIASPSAPFATNSVTLEMRQIGFLDGRTTPILFTQTYDVTAEWTRIALRMGSGNLARIDEASAASVLELAIYPFDLVEAEPGSVMIADPRLRFFIDGYTD